MCQQYFSIQPGIFKFMAGKVITGGIEYIQDGPAFIFCNHLAGAIWSKNV
jgi:hypothetical protein